jgi:hypothetical protein
MTHEDASQALKDAVLQTRPTHIQDPQNSGFPILGT